MKPVRKALLGLLVQAALVAFGLYLGLSEQALPDATALARAGIAALFVGVAILLGETSKLRVQFAALLSTLQSGLGATVPRDDRMAVDVLVAARESHDAAVREKAHRNLVRITRKDLPADPTRWKAWWSEAREGFPMSGEAPRA
jgi:membrane-bound ClpP family serine protease